MYRERGAWQRDGDRRGCRPATGDGVTLQDLRIAGLQSLLPAILQLQRLPLLSAALGLLREDTGDLLHRLADLDVERLLPKLHGRTARVAGDAVVLARRVVAIRRPARLATR